jgi:hypothetical protein
MFTRARMLGGVLIRRVIATAGRAAFLADPEMNPTSADFHALIALTILRVFDGCDDTDVRTSCVWHVTPSYSAST